MNIEIILFIVFTILMNPIGSMSWIIDVKKGGIRTANKIARKHNMINKGKVGHIRGLYLLDDREQNYQNRKRRSIDGGYVPYLSEKEMITDVTNLLFHEKGVFFVEPQKELSRKKRGFQPDQCCDNFNDPEYSNQWYFKNDLRLDTNIYGAWKQGITGKGVVVSILDDGVEHTHDDLKDNWDPQASYDFNNNDLDPSPRLSDEVENMHGTRCAGQVAAAANNSKCGVGAAFEASIGGVRMLDGRVTDAVECSSITFKRNHIDIYSISWGPDDDGKAVDGPKYCTKQALKDGARKGRKGKGSIFVWASGNGGKWMDDCNLDGYVSSIYTIAISAISSSGLSPWYSESCSCTLASVYSSGFSTEDKIVTTDVLNSCTNEHTGTSAAAPLAAGILALVLQANMELTWRDMQHLIVRTASRVSNDRQDKWITNGAGHEFHHKLGFGVLDATKMVNMARNWTTVPPQRKCMAMKVNHTKTIPPQKKLTIITPVHEDSCFDRATGLKGNKHLNKLEHVQLILTMSTAMRGDIMLKLQSPSGTISKLLSMRPEDRESSKFGFKNWAFMTTNFWDENPYGRWGFHIINGNQRLPNMMHQTRLKRIKLMFYGSGPRDAPPQEDLEEEDIDEDFSTNEARELVEVEDDVVDEG